MIDVVIMVAVLGGGALAVKLLSSKESREADEIWTMAGRRLGAELEITQARFLRPAERRLYLTVEGTPLVVLTGQEAAPLNRDAYYTRVSAGPLSRCGAARIHASKRDLLRKVSKRLGIGELSTGHADFDDAVHVSGSPRGLVLAFFDAPTRGLVRESDAGFDLEDAFVVVQRLGVPKSSGPLVDMTRFAQRIVERWHALARGPVRLAERLSLVLEGGWELGAGTGAVATGVRRSRRVTLSLRLDVEVAHSLLAFDDPSRGEWTMERDDSGGFVTSGHPPEAIRTLARTAAAALLGMRAVAGTIELAFDGLAPDDDAVETTLDAVLDATLAAAPYR